MLKGPDLMKDAIREVFKILDVKSGLCMKRIYHIYGFSKPKIIFMWHKNENQQ